MFCSTFRMTVHLAVLTIAAMLIVTSATGAEAVKGKAAVAVCIDSIASGARCEWAVNDKGEIDVCNKSGCVYCPSKDGNCTAAARGRLHPTRGLPVGAIVRTPVINVEISKTPYSGPILGLRCPAGTTYCVGHGCVADGDSCTSVD